SSSKGEPELMSVRFIRQVRDTRMTFRQQSLRLSVIRYRPRSNQPCNQADHEPVEHETNHDTRCTFTKTLMDHSTGAPRAAQNRKPKSAPLAHQLEQALARNPPVRVKKIATIRAAITVAPLASAHSRGPSLSRQVPGVMR